MAVARWNDTDIDLKPPWRRLSVRDAVAELGGQPADLFDDAAKAAEVALSVGGNPHAVAAALLEPFDAAPAKPEDLAKQLGAGDRGAIARVVDAYGSPETNRVVAGGLGYLVFEHTAEDKLVEPTFLTDFPLAVSPLARKKEGDPALCDRFELIVGGAEIANAFSELNDPDDQRERFQAQVRAKAAGADETMDYDEDYCVALEVGMPPAAGEGIGIDRLTMLLTGQPSIRDVILFPLMKPE